MDTLPSEVYSQIVQLLRPLNGKRIPRHVTPPEITMSHVSRGWRQLAFSDSKSWDMIEIYSPRSLPRAEAYASRSAATILRVELYDYENRVKRSGSRLADEHRNFVQALTGLLRDVAPKCRSILLFTLREGTAQEIASAFKEVGAPYLESLRVEINDLEEEEENEGETKYMPISVFAGQAVGALRTVSLETPAIPPLRNVTTLELHSLSPNWFSFAAFTRIATEAVSLENLSLSSRSRIPDWPTHLDAPAITLPTLKNLKIADEYPGLTAKAILSISAPNLESLFIRATSSTLHHFFSSPQHESNKFPKLQYLTLESFDMQDVELFAKAFPSITHLRLLNFVVYYSTHFAREMSAGFLWPQLHTLVFGVSKDDQGVRWRRACVEIVASRRVQGLPLPVLMGDEDVLAVLRRSDFLNETAGMRVLDLQSYREPWWVMSHEKRMDMIGML